jgi:hypothetical protein
MENIQMNLNSNVELNNIEQRHFKIFRKTIWTAKLMSLKQIVSTNITEAWRDTVMSNLSRISGLKLI